MELGLLSLDSLLSILWGRRWTVMATALVCLITAGALSFIASPKYTATVTLVIDFQEPVGDTEAPLAATLQPNYLTTQIGIIYSRNVARKVVDMLQLESNPGWKTAFVEATEGVGSMRDWIAGALLGGLEVVPGTGSRLVNISYTAGNPEAAAEVANGFARAYERTNLEMSTQPARREAEHHEQALRELRANVERAQQQLSAFQSEKEIVVTDERLDLETERLKEIVAQRIRAESEVQAAQSKLERIEELRARGESFEALPDVLANDVIRDMKGRLAAKEAEFADVSRQLGKNHPRYRSVAAEVAALRSGLKSEAASIAVSVRNEVAQAQARLRGFVEAERTQKTQVLRLKRDRDPLPALVRELESAQASYEQGLALGNQYMARSRLSQTNVTLLNPALVPTSPSSPDIPKNLLLSAVLGIFLGLGIALLRELMDRRVRTQGELIEATGIPFLGQLPADRK